MNISDFTGKQPTFVLERFFEGRSQGWGVMQSRFGTFQQQFMIEASGRWDEAARTLRLTEIYTFDDGHVDKLEWTIRKTSEGSYEGREPRVDGVAKGEQAGNAYHWTYRRRVPSKDGSESSNGFDDWLASGRQDPDREGIRHKARRRAGNLVSVLSEGRLKT